MRGKVVVSSWIEVGQMRRVNVKKVDTPFTWSEWSGEGCDTWLFKLSREMNYDKMNDMTQEMTFEGRCVGARREMLQEND